MSAGARQGCGIIRIMTIFLSKIESHSKILNIVLDADDEAPCRLMGDSLPAWGDAIPTVLSSSSSDDTDEAEGGEGEVVSQLRRQLAQCRGALDRQCIEKSRLQGELKELRAETKHAPDCSPGMLHGSSAGAPSVRAGGGWGSSPSMPSTLLGVLGGASGIGNSYEAEWRAPQPGVPLPCHPPPAAPAGSASSIVMRSRGRGRCFDSGASGGGGSHSGGGSNTLLSPSALLLSGGAATPAEHRKLRASAGAHSPRSPHSPQALAEQRRAASAHQEAAIAVVRLQCDAALASALAAKDAECAHKIQQALAPREGMASATAAAVQAAVRAAERQHQAALSAREAALRREAREQAASQLEAALAAQHEADNAQLHDSEQAKRRACEQLAVSRGALAALRDEAAEVSGLKSAADRRIAHLDGTVQATEAAMATGSAEHRAELAKREASAAAELAALARRLSEEFGEAEAQARSRADERLKASADGMQKVVDQVDALKTDLRVAQEQVAACQAAAASQGGQSGSQEDAASHTAATSALQLKLASAREQCQKARDEAKAQRQLATKHEEHVQKVQSECSRMRTQHLAEMASRGEEMERAQSEGKLVLEALKRNHSAAMQAQADEHLEWLRSAEGSASGRLSGLSRERDEAIAQVKQSKDTLRLERADLERRLHTAEKQHEATLERARRDCAALLQSRADEHTAASELVRRSHTDERASMRQDAAKERAGMKAAESAATGALRREIAAQREGNEEQRAAHARAKAQAEDHARELATLTASSTAESTAASNLRAEQATQMKERDERVRLLEGELDQERSGCKAALASAESFAQQLQALLKQGEASKVAASAAREKKLARAQDISLQSTRQAHQQEMEKLSAELRASQHTLQSTRQAHQQEVKKIAAELQMAQCVEQEDACERSSKEAETLQNNKELRSSLASAEGAFQTLLSERDELLALNRASALKLAAMEAQHRQRLQAVENDAAGMLAKRTVEHEAVASQLIMQRQASERKQEQQAQEAAQAQKAVSQKAYQDGLHAFGRERDLRMQLQEELLDLKAHIRVFCRIRPPVAHELAGGSTPQTLSRVSVPNITGSGYGRTVRVEAPVKYCGDDGGGTDAWSHKFDRAFGPETTQEQLYSEVRLLVASAVDHGGCATVFAYGATGAGKTYTMGSGFEGNYDHAFGDEQRSSYGIIPRAIEDLWQRKEEAVAATPGKVPQQLAISVLEVYNNHVFDLLPVQRCVHCEAAESVEPIPAAPDSVRMFSSHELCKHGNAAGQAKGGGEDALRCRRKVFGSSGIVEGRAWVVVRSVEEAHLLLGKAASRRAVAAHKMNARSSRSHLIVSLELRESRSPAAAAEKTQPQRKFSRSRRPSLRARSRSQQSDRPRSLSPVPSPRPAARQKPRVAEEAISCSNDDDQSSAGYGSADDATPAGVDQDTLDELPAWKKRGKLDFVDLAGSEVRVLQPLHVLAALATAPLTRTALFVCPRMWRNRECRAESLKRHARSTEASLRLATSFRSWRRTAHSGSMCPFATAC